MIKSTPRSIMDDQHRAFCMECQTNHRLSVVNTWDVLHDLEIAERLAATQEVRSFAFLAPRLIRRGPVLVTAWRKRLSRRLNVELARLKQKDAAELPNTTIKCLTSTPNERSRGKALSWRTSQ